MKETIRIQVQVENNQITLSDRRDHTIQLSIHESEAMRSLLIDAEMDIKYPTLSKEKLA